MQGVKALGIAVLGGELQNVNNVSLLVSLDIAGDDDALAVSQTLACQVLALVLRACIVQVQLGHLAAGGVVHGVLGRSSLSLRGSSFGGSSHGRGSSRGCGGGCSGRGRAAAGGHADSQCQSGSGNCNSLELHREISFFFFCWCQAPGSIPTASVVLMSFHYTHVDEKSKLFSSKINDKIRIVTILT